MLKKKPFSTLKPFRHDFPLIKTPDLFATQRAREAGWEFEPDASRLYRYIQPHQGRYARKLKK